MAHWKHHLHCLLVACLALVWAFMVLSPVVQASLLLLPVVSSSLVMGSLVWARAVASSLAVCSLMLPGFVTFCPALSWPKIA